MSHFRSVIFWSHLAAGILVGLVVLIMSLTGVALTFEKQMLEWADLRAWSTRPPPDAGPLAPQTLLARVRAAMPEAAPTTLTLRADPTAPATVAFEDASLRLVDPYTGAVIGPPPTGLRSFFRVMTGWHRWLAREGASRPLGKSVTGASTLAFLFMVVSGVYLWVPRVWTRVQFRNALWFRSGLATRARDFNWHNVIGIWSALPLAVVILGALPISYPWASDLVYRMAGETPPARRAAATPAAVDLDRTIDLTGIDDAFRDRTRLVPDWRTVTVRVPAGSRSTFTLTVDQGYGGQPQKRGTLTVDRSRGTPPRWERFGDLSTGRRLRSWLRFAHTGEYYGIAGQTVAGLASAGGVVLVWTGLALAWRRLRTWQRRRTLHAPEENTQRAA